MVSFSISFSGRLVVMIKGRPERILRSMTLKIIPSTLFLQKICIYRFEQTILLLEISDKHFHTCLSSYSFSISVPGHTKSYKEILHFGKCAASAKTSETGSSEASALTPSCIHISFFSRLISVSTCCKNHFYAGSKMSLHIFKR